MAKPVKVRERLEISGDPDNPTFELVITEETIHSRDNRYTIEGIDREWQELEDRQTEILEIKANLERKIEEAMK